MNYVGLVDDVFAARTCIIFELIHGIFVLDKGYVNNTCNCRTYYKEVGLDVSKVRL